MQRMNIGGRLGLLTLTSFVALCVLLGVALVDLRYQMEAERKGALQGVVDTVASLIEADSMEVASGKMTHDQFIERMQWNVKHARYGGGNYFVVYGWDGTLLAGGTIGQNL